MPDAVHRVNVLLALPAGAGGPVRFGAVAAPFVAVTGLDGTEIASYTITGLDAESAVVALELYRRQGAWKVRAVGQGYAGGLAALLTDQGLPEARQLADAINEAVAQGLARSVAAPPPRTPTATVPGRRRAGPAQAGRRRQARGHPARAPPQPVPRSPGGPRRRQAAQPTPPPPASRQHRAAGARSTTATPAADRRPPPPPPPRPRPSRAARRSPSRVTPPAGPWTSGSTTRSGACSRTWPAPPPRTAAPSTSPTPRMEQELDQVAGRPAQPDRRPGRRRPRGGPRQARPARRPGPGRPSTATSPSSPPSPRSSSPRCRLPYARWDNPVWHGYRVPDGAARWRCASATCGCPRARAAYPDAGAAAAGARPVDRQRTPSRRPRRLAHRPDELRRLAMETAVAHAARLLAVHPAGEFAVHVIDPAGSGAAGARAAGADRGARRPARRRRRGRGGRPGPAHPARRPGADGGARRRRRLAAARPRHRPSSC